MFFQNMGKVRNKVEGLNEHNTWLSGWTKEVAQQNMKDGDMMVQTKLNECTNKSFNQLLKLRRNEGVKRECQRNCGFLRVEMHIGHAVNSLVDLF